MEYTNTLNTLSHYGNDQETLAPSVGGKNLFAPQQCELWKKTISLAGDNIESDNSDNKY